MPWTSYVAYFFGGVFVANSLPHLIAGVSGRELPTPFASPPFRGMSSPPVNIVWALVNLAVAYVLIVHVGTFDVRSWANAGILVLGFGVMAIQCGRSIARTREDGDGRRRDDG